jgi:hypothetical protein
MSFVDRLQSSFAQLGEFIPALLGALVILFAGYHEGRKEELSENLPVHHCGSCSNKMR